MEEISTIHRFSQLQLFAHNLLQFSTSGRSPCSVFDKLNRRMGRAFRTSPSCAAHSSTPFRNCSAGATIPNALALGRTHKRTHQINKFCVSKISQQTVGLQIPNVRSLRLPCRLRSLPSFCKAKTSSTSYYHGSIRVPIFAGTPSSCMSNFNEGSTHSLAL